MVSSETPSEWAVAAAASEAADGDVKLAFYPESSENFFAKIMDAQITFVTDSEGHVAELLFHRSGSTQHVKRVD